MRRRRHNRSASPIYTFIGVWILMSMMGVRLFDLAGLIVAAGIAVLAGVGVAALLKGRADKRTKEAAQAAQEAADRVQAEAKQAAEDSRKEKSPYSPEVQAIIAEGRVAMKEMGRLYKSIPDPGVKQKINELMSVSDKIVRDAIDDPTDVPQIRKFLDYYLPTTIKLLNAYDRMGAQDVQGENITGSMQRIEDMLDTTIEAYKKQLDALFANQAADIQMDIEIMNGMLAREGLGGKGYLDLKDFMKKYEAQQKKEEQEKAKNDTQKNENEQKGMTANG